jgi:hypothetical protein
MICLFLKVYLPSAQREREKKEKIIAIKVLQNSGEDKKAIK